MHDAAKGSDKKTLAYKLSHEGILLFNCYFFNVFFAFCKICVILTTKFARPSKILLPSLFAARPRQEEIIWSREISHY